MTDHTEHLWWQSVSRWLYSMVSQGMLVVLPAFQPAMLMLKGRSACTANIRSMQSLQWQYLQVSVSATLMPAGGKAEALAGVGQGLLQPFHVNRFAAGHNATDFPRWLASDELYGVQYTMVSSLRWCHRHV